MDIATIRRLNLLSLIRAAGSITALAKQTDVSAPYISQIKTKFRDMGTPTARRIETKLGIPAGTMDTVHEWKGFQPMPSTTSGNFEFGQKEEVIWKEMQRSRFIDVGEGDQSIQWVKVDLFVDLTDAATPYIAAAPLRSIQFSASYLQTLVGAVDLEALSLVVMPGDGMAPTIDSRDLLLMDTASPKALTDGIYFFTYKGAFHVKRLQIVGDRIGVRSDNTNYETWHVEASDVGALEVHGRIIAAIPMSHAKRLG